MQYQKYQIGAIVKILKSSCLTNPPNIVGQLGTVIRMTMPNVWVELEDGKTAQFISNELE